VKNCEVDKADCFALLGKALTNTDFQSRVKFSFTLQF